MRPLLALLALALPGMLPRPAAALSTERVLQNLSSPVFVASPPGDPRLFVVERAGVIRIYANGALLPNAFLDITSEVNQDGEGGLLSVAFPPDYAASQTFYVYYTADGSGGNPQESRISRFRASPLDPNRSDPLGGTPMEKVLLRVDQPFDNHDGGTVAFGPDGYLYMGFGDGGDANDPLDAGQRTDILLAKMLRLDVSFSNFNDGYDVPNDNPFVGVPGRDEIWALGVRNPFRFSFDRQEHDLYIGDVGQGDREEIDVEPAGDPGGRNYGWDVMEGTGCFSDPDGADPSEPACNSPGLTLPVYDYPHNGPICNSVTGGVVYRGPVSELQGQYLFAEYCSGELFSLVWDGAGGIVGGVVDRTADFAPDAGSIDDPVAFGEDAAGDVYIVDLDGEIFRVAPEPGRAALLATGAALLLGVRVRRPR
jgi:glucose/arabinose dehydrogenase